MTTMVLIEVGLSMNEKWECSNCGEQFKATVKFEKNKQCPNCTRIIKKWIGADDYSEEETI